MTYAQFRRMKPKYKRRLFLVILCAAALAAALLFGASKGVQADPRRAQHNHHQGRNGSQCA